MGGPSTRERSMPRRAVMAALIVVGLLGDVGGQSAELLTPGVPVTREMATGAHHSYHLALEAGEFTVIAVTAANIDGLIKVVDPQGRTVIDRAPSEAGIVAPIAGRYVVEVRADSATAPPQRYTISSSPPTPARAEDRTRAAADLVLVDARRLWTEGKTASIREGVEQARRAADLFHQTGERRREAVALLALTDCLSTLGEQDQARQSGTQALEIARALGDPRREADANLALGATYQSQPDRTQSLAYYREALSLYERAGEERRQARILFNMGNAFNELDQSQNAVDHFDRALATAIRLNDREIIARTYNGLGVVRNGLGELPAALDALTRALTASRNLGSGQIELMVLNNLGIV